jgi:hypothetical protein
MTQDLDSTKTAALPLQETFEDGGTTPDVAERQRIKHLADEMAERANDRTKSYDDTAPDQQVFTK